MTSFSLSFNELPTLITNEEWADDYVSISNNFIIGQSGSYIYQGSKNNENASYFFEKVYQISSNNPSINYGFPINQNMVTNTENTDLSPININETKNNFNFTNQPYFKINNDNKLISNISNQIIMFKNIPYPGITQSHFANGLRFQGTAFLKLNDDTYLHTAIVYWPLSKNNNVKYPLATSIIAFHSLNLKEWTFLSVIANASDYPYSEEGITKIVISAFFLCFVLCV